MRRARLVLALAAVAVIAALGAVHVGSAYGAPSAKATTTVGCSFKNGIKHVIYLQFDNGHIQQARPPLASDLELMPNLLNLLKTYGTVIDNHHTVLISHTSDGILSSLTGLYPDRQGITVGNSYRYYRNDGS